jgi:hypothetical protein
MLRLGLCWPLGVSLFVSRAAPTATHRELLRAAGEARHPEPELPRRRAVEPWRLGERPGRQPGQDQVRLRHGQVLPPKSPGAVVRPLPEGQGQARPARGAGVPDRQQPVGGSRPVAAAPPEGRLAFAPPPPGSEPPFDSYVSDPGNPVPNRPRPVPPTYPGPEWPVWLLQDQRFVHRRPDVLSWETEPWKKTSWSPTLCTPTCSPRPPAPTATGS